MLIGDPALTALYGAALELLDLPSRSLDGGDCVFRGLRLIFSEDN
jgi:2-keto-3-deoxy-galactonokinase